MDQHPTPPTAPGSSAEEFVSIHEMDRRRDEEHLRILSILFYVFGGLTALGGCGGLVYVVMGIALAAAPQGAAPGPDGNAPPEWLGALFALIGGCITILLCALAGLVIYAGWCLSSHRNRVFCMVIAILMCLSIPLGTILGVFTLVVLSRPSVVGLFNVERRVPAA